MIAAGRLWSLSVTLWEQWARQHDYRPCLCDYGSSGRDSTIVVTICETMEAVGAAARLLSVFETMGAVGAAARLSSLFVRLSEQWARQNDYRPCL